MLTHMYIQAHVNSCTYYTQAGRDVYNTHFQSISDNTIDFELLVFVPYFNIYPVTFLPSPQRVLPVQMMGREVST